MVDLTSFINFHGFRFGQAEQLQGSAEFSVITGVWSLIRKPRKTREESLRIWDVSYIPSDAARFQDSSGN